MGAALMAALAGTLLTWMLASASGHHSIATTAQAVAVGISGLSVGIYIYQRAKAIKKKKEG